MSETSNTEESVSELDALHNDVKRLLENPTSRYSLVEGIEIPAGPAIRLLSEELESISDPNSEDRLLARMATRIGLDKLIKSHNVVTNYFLRTCQQMDIKLIETVCLFGDPSSVKTQVLEIEETGVYTDVQISSLMVLLSTKIKGMLESKKASAAEIERLRNEVARKDKIIEEKVSEISKIKNAPKKEFPIGASVLYMRDESGNKTYVGVDKDTPSEYTLVGRVNRAKLFPNAQQAISFYRDLIDKTRNYNFKGAADLEIGNILMESDDLNFLGNEGRFSLEKSRSTIRDYEDFREAEKNPEPVTSSNNFEEEASTSYISDPTDRGYTPSVKKKLSSKKAVAKSKSSPLLKALARKAHKRNK